MFFLLSKTLDLLVDPLWWGLGALALGVALLAQGARRRAGAALSHLGLAVLLLAAAPAVSNRLWYALEADAPTTFHPEETYDAVVLLGGTVDSHGSRREEAAWNENVERLLVTRELLVAGRAKVALVTGGELGHGLRTEAEYLADALVRLGVPADRVVLEPKAANTRENARYAKPLLEARGATKVLLVTSAFHLPRALGCFRAVGLEPDALPVDFRLRDVTRDPHWAPRAEYLAQSAQAVREVVGRWVYRAMGYAR